MVNSKKAAKILQQHFAEISNQEFVENLKKSSPEIFAEKNKANVLATKNSLEKFKRHLNEYQPQLEQALAAIQILQIANPESEEFADALAKLQVCATILEPYSEGMIEAIDVFVEDAYQDEVKKRIIF